MIGLTPREEHLAANGLRAAEVIQGLRNFMAFLAAHPSLPLGLSNPLYLSVIGDDDTGEHTEVDRIAAILGAGSQCMHGSTDYYGTSRDFGGGVVYRAVAVAARRMAASGALASYAGCVQPESPVAA